MSFTGGQVSSQDGIVQCVQVYRHRMVSLTVIPCLQLTKGRLHDIHWLAWWWLCYSITVFNTTVCKQLVYMCPQLINKTITDQFCKIRKLLYYVSQENDFKCSPLCLHKQSDVIIKRHVSGRVRWIGQLTFLEQWRTLYTF